MERIGILFCLVGPAGGGKTSIAQKLLAEPNTVLKASVSVASRAPREGEIDGISYKFVSRNHFEKMISEKAFFEYEEIHGNFYGTLRSNLEEVKGSGNDLLLVIDIKGALNVKKNFPKNTVICFLVPPSREVLEKRLSGRGVISKEDFSKRLETAKTEYKALQRDISASGEIDYLVINNELDKSYQTVSAILMSERQRLGRISNKTIKDLSEGLV